MLIFVIFVKKMFLTFMGAIKKHIGAIGAIIGAYTRAVGAHQSSSEQCWLAPMKKAPVQLDTGANY